MERLLAYFLTWTTYGTWLPGDQRGWVDKHERGPNLPFRPPDPRREAAARFRMADTPVTLHEEARRVVDEAIRETCAYKNWDLHALNVRSNHVHAVISASQDAAETVLKTAKAYASRALNDRITRRTRWWTEGGSRRYIKDQAGLSAVIRYVMEGQEGRW